MPRLPGLDLYQEPPEEDEDDQEIDPAEQEIPVDDQEDFEV